VLFFAIRLVTSWILAQKLFAIIVVLVFGLFSGLSFFGAVTGKM
jgi:hypothetical protein